MLFRFCVLFFVLVANLFGWPQMPKQQSANSSRKTTHPDQDKKRIPPIHVIVDPPFPLSVPKPDTTGAQTEPQEKPLPRFTRAEWVIVYVTIVYAFIAWWTLKTIKKQTKVMEGQAKTAETQTALLQDEAKIMHAQWIDLDNWKTELSTNPLDRLHVWVDIGNSTAFPLTITEVSLNIGATGFTLSERVFLPQRKRPLWILPSTLTKEL
jgi:hypothetical protein